MDTEELIRSLCDRYFERFVAEDRTERRGWRGPDERLDDQIMHAYLEPAEDESERMASGDRSRMVEPARALLEEAGPALEGQQFDHLCWELQRTHLRALRHCADEWRRDFSGQGRLKEHGAASGSGLRKPSKLLGEVVGVFLDRERPKWAEKTAKGYEKELAHFVAAFGSGRRLDSISRADIEAYAHQRSEPKGDGAGAPAAATVQKAMSNIHRMFDYAFDLEWIERNPVAGKVKRESRREARGKRDAFTNDDLAAIFGPGYADAARNDPARFWLPLVLLYTGARREEIASLRVVDVVEIDSRWAIEIRPNEGQSLKTEQSERTVPIHAQLEELGFVEYVSRMRREGSERLFPNLVPNKNGYGDAVGKWFGRRLRKVGIASSKKVLHSFRHTVATRLKEADVQEFAIAEMLGHENASITTGRYGKALDLGRLADAIEKLDFRGPLSALFRAP